MNHSASGSARVVLAAQPSLPLVKPHWNQFPDLCIQPNFKLPFHHLLWCGCPGHLCFITYSPVCILSLSEHALLPTIQMLWQIILFFTFPLTPNSKTLHKITIYRINKSHWEAHAICLTERILLSRGQKASRQVQSQEDKDLPVSPRSSNTREPEEPSSKPLRHSKVSGAARLISSNKIHSPLFTAWAKAP